MKLQHPEILGASVALATALSSFTWFGYFAPRPGNPESSAGHASSIPGPYQRSSYNRQLEAFVQWLPPPVQSRSGQWVYDLFTPPEIFYDAKLETFTVTPPVTTIAADQLHAPDAGEEVFAGLQVVEVKQVLFRLQLIGFVKTDRDYIGVFENRVTGEVRLAPRMHAFSELGLVIEDIDVRRNEISEDTGASQLVAVARIRDTATGELVTLSTASRCFAPTARATLIAFAPSQTERDVGEGDLWEIDGVTYEIDKIHISPAAVVIKRRDGGSGNSDRFTLSALGVKSPETPHSSL